MGGIFGGTWYIGIFCVGKSLVVYMRHILCGWNLWWYIVRYIQCGRNLRWYVVSPILCCGIFGGT